jgi:hypothetical protein
MAHSTVTLKEVSGIAASSIRCWDAWVDFDRQFTFFDRPDGLHPVGRIGSWARTGAFTASHPRWRTQGVATRGTCSESRGDGTFSVLYRFDMPLLGTPPPDLVIGPYSL